MSMLYGQQLYGVFIIVPGCPFSDLLLRQWWTRKWRRIVLIRTRINHPECESRYLHTSRLKGYDLHYWRVTEN